MEPLITGLEKLPAFSGAVALLKVATASKGQVVIDLTLGERMGHLHFWGCDYVHTDMAWQFVGIDISRRGEQLMVTGRNSRFETLCEDVAFIEDDIDDDAAD